MGDRDNRNSKRNHFRFSDPDARHSLANRAPNRRTFLTVLASGFASACVIPARAQRDQPPGGFQLPQARSEQVRPQFRETLLQFGAFSQHPIYGEIWTPGPQTAPQGWHPYSPCHWVNTKKFGWYYDDKTPWGQIVHHYGRWKNDPSTGWFWVPGEEFSPGWVLWRANPQYVGWAPMPPDQDLQNAQAASIENTDSWLFMDVSKFGNSCDGATLPPNMYPVILRDTQFITKVKFVDGIIVYEFPVYIVGPFIDIVVSFAPWPLWFFTQIFVYWNWIWTYALIFNVKVNCEPPYTPGGGSHGGMVPVRR